MMRVWEYLIACMAVVTISASAFAQDDYVRCPMPDGWSRIGKIIPKPVSESSSLMLTVGCEVLDRDYTDYDEYKTYLQPLGIRKIRLQAGWAKTEKVKGVYDFAWLDHIIDDALARGLEIWLQTSYGNPVYEGGGTVNLGGGVPVSPEAKAAWDRWVETMARRYLGKVHEWEIWNEPDLSAQISAEAIADINVRTARIIKSVDPNAKIAGLAFCVLDPGLLTECMDLIRDAGALDLFHWISYHGYAYRPEDSYHGVEKFRKIIARYSDRILLRQGENGAPSKGHMGGALDDYDWTELSQAKWDLRRLAGDHGHDVESSVFSIIDMAYPPGENEYVTKLNVKGLIESTPDKKAVRPKLAYYAVQNYASLFNHFLTRVKNPGIKISGDGSWSRYMYRDVRGIPSVLVWNDAAVPLNTNDMVPVTVSVSDAVFSDPVWIDILSGEIYEIPDGDCIRNGNGCILENVPVYDSPILITDKNLLD